MTLNQWLSDNYENVKQHLQKYCTNRGLEWSEDTFHLTLLKCLEKGRLHDMSDRGILNYLFMAFKTNTLRERQYPYNARRSVMDELPDLPSQDNSDDDHEAEAKSDFKAHVIMRLIELAFSQDHYNAFRLKTFSDLTYKQLQAMTGLQHPRRLVKEVRDWLSENVDETELEKRFFSGMSPIEAAEDMFKQNGQEYD